MSNTVEIIRNSLTSRVYDGVPIAAGGGGSALIISNVGDGSGVFKTQTSSEAYFKSLKPGQNIGLDSDTNTITINYTGTPNSNLSGYITTGQADSRYYNINNPSGYITGFNSGQYITTGQTGQFYPVSNPNNYISSGSVSTSYATISNLQSTGSNLNNKINSLSGYSNSNFATIVNLASTGSNLQTQINNINNGTGIFVSLNQTGQFYPNSNPSGYVNNSSLSSYVQTTYVNTGFVPKGRYNSFCANAGAMAPLASGGATASSVSFSNTHYFDVYSFDAASEQGVTFTFSLPDTYNSGTLKTRYFWGVASGGISGVVFGACARAYVSGDALNQSYGQEILTTGFASASGIIFENLSNPITLNGNISGSRSFITTKIARKVNDPGDVCNVAAYLYQINMQWQESYAEPQQWN